MNKIRSKYHFKVATNSAGQRILIVGDDYRHFSYEPVPFEDFDALYFETDDHAVLKRQMSSLMSVSGNPNYNFKPLFVKPSITKSSLLELTDGQCSSIDSKELIDETKRISQRFVSLRFQIFDREPSFWTPENIIYHMIRTILVRSDKFPEWKLSRNSSFGYAIPYIEEVLKHKVISAKGALQYWRKVCVDHKLFKYDKLKAVVHVCPHCYENKTILNEVCPKCGSIDIEEVQMIHHFRCANISSEESYLSDGRLVCPKCKQELKHIGVDYDRPASMYYCRENGIYFSTPIINAVCANCGKSSEVSKLVKVKLYDLEYTSLGIATFSQYDHVRDSDDIPKLPSLYSFNNFLQVLRIRIQISRNESDLRLALFRLRVTPEDNYELIDNVVMHRTYKRYPNAIMSYKNGAFYVLHAFMDMSIEEFANEFLSLKDLNKQNPGYTFDGEYIELDINRDIDSIIASI